MSAIRKAPWQVGLAIGATFVAAAAYLVDALAHFFFITDSELEIARVAEVAYIHGGLEQNLEDVVRFDNHMAQVFALIGVVLLILGAFLWVGAYRPGVRLILTITMAVSFIGSFIPLNLSFDPATGLSSAQVGQAVVVQFVALISALLLWFGAGRRWVALDTTSSWEQN
jgi:hypothetical protein